MDRVNGEKPADGSSGGGKASMLAGLYKVYGLIYLVGAERDLVRVRTNYRHEDIYLYRTTASPERARAMFLDYIKSLNDLSFADLRRQAVINEKAKEADQDPEFSRRIRESLVGF